MIYFSNIDQISIIHDQLIEQYGGTSGIRDESFLLSALEMPKQGFGDQYMHQFPFEMAAAYFFHIAKNHAFIDGNKRTATAVSLTFLLVNSYKCTLSSKALEDLAVDIATSKYDKQAIAQILEQNCIKID